MTETEAYLELPIPTGRTHDDRLSPIERAFARGRLRAPG